jgi:hypothetical protein
VPKAFRETEAATDKAISPTLRRVRRKIASAVSN